MYYICAFKSVITHLKLLLNTKFTIKRHYDFKIMSSLIEFKEKNIEIVVTVKQYELETLKITFWFIYVYLFHGYIMMYITTNDLFLFNITIFNKILKDIIMGYN